MPSPPWHLDIFDDKQYELFIKTIKKLHDETDYAIMLGVGCNLFEMGTWLRRFDNFLSDIMLDKAGVERLLDKLVEGYLKNLERILSGVKDYVDQMCIRDRYILPSFLLVFLLLLVPMFQNIYYSFFQWNGIAEPIFNGFSNYIQLFKDSNFFTSLINTDVYKRQLIIQCQNSWMIVLHVQMKEICPM